MKKAIYLIVLLTLLVLAGCDAFFPGPKICNPKYNVTEEQVKKDLEENKQEYLDIIELLNKEDLQISFILYYKHLQEIEISINDEDYKDLNEIGVLTEVE